VDPLWRRARLLPLGLALWAGGLGATLTSLPSAFAEDDTPLLCVLRPKQRGLSVRDVALLDATVSRWLRQSGRLATSARERDLIIDQEGLSSCYDESCLDRIGRMLQVQRVVAYRVYAQPSAPGGAPDSALSDRPPDEEPAPAGEHWRQFSIRVSVHNVEAGARGGEAEAACPRCSLQQAAGLLGRALTEAAQGDTTRPRGRLQVTSAPPGATVVIDGIETETTPYDRPLFVGRHEITLRRSGFRSHVMQIELGPAQTLALSHRFEPGRDSKTALVLVERAPRPAWRLGLGGGLLAVGLGGLTLGAMGFILDGRCVNPPLPPAVVCDAIYTSQTTALAYGLGGLALSTAGLLLLAWPGPKTPPPPSSPLRDTFGEPR